MMIMRRGRRSQQPIIAVFSRHFKDEFSSFKVKLHCFFEELMMIVQFLRFPPWYVGSSMERFMCLSPGMNLIACGEPGPVENKMFYKDTMY
ncbi:hypothetical protein E2C01_061182 [Portunus trituberculatus]|uniref:Uncharacterized protein n=1 Tax=Portunus trituberculatus TaxID=210409 RepID=A0A5B7H7F7_PORTR|nr:hypothetical protein [Portunus trituberculatus]